MTEERAAEWVALGHQRRHFFPHRAHRLPKCGPDGFRLGRWMAGQDEPATMWQLVLHARDPVLAQFPAELFFDDDVQWHRQQFGMPGHIASVNLIVRGSSVHTTAHFSDFVQRIGRRREHKTRVEKRFAGWDRMLLNAVLDFAIERGMRSVHIPRSDHALAHTDRARAVQRELFERIYDSHPRGQCPLEPEGRWWRIDVAAAAGRVVRLAEAAEPLPGGRAICVFHDIERGAGHTATDPEFAERAERTSGECLSMMLASERRAGVRATYNVLGSLLTEVREELEADGHCLAFHSYDHRIGDDSPQLDACRELDYRLKGYRPPQSRMTAELTEPNLLFHNFEWLAGSPRLVGVRSPQLLNRLVRLPVHADDFDLYRGVPYEDWEAALLATVEQNSFTAVGLHDCYGELWLPRYERLLDKLGGMGRLVTMDAAAAEATLAVAV